MLPKPYTVFSLSEAGAPCAAGRAEGYGAGAVASVTVLPLCGSQPQQNGAGLRHIERIESTGKRNMQNAGTALGNAGTHALFLVAEYKNGRQAQDFSKGIDGCRPAAARAVNGQSGFFGTVQRVAEIVDAGNGQSFQGSRRRALRSGAEVGAVVAGQQQASAAQSVQGAAKRTQISGVLYLIKGKQQGQGGRMYRGKHGLQRLECRDDKAGYHSLMTDMRRLPRAAQAVKSSPVHQRVAQVVVPAQLLNPLHIGTSQSLAAVDEIDALRRIMQKFQNGLDARQKRGGNSIFHRGLRQAAEGEAALLP